MLGGEIAAVGICDCEAGVTVTVAVAACSAMLAWGNQVTQLSHDHSCPEWNICYDIVRLEIDHHKEVAMVS